MSAVFPVGPLQPDPDEIRAVTGRDAEREQLAAAQRRKIHQAVYDEMVDHPMWIDDRGRGLHYNPEREERIGDFLRSVADALLPVVDRIANERAAAELRTAAAGIVDGALLSDLPGAARQALAIAARVVRDRAAALRASNGNEP